MKTITPSAELWQQPEDWHEHVARCARVCYASETGSLTPEVFCDSLIKKGHLSMFRHASRYFVFMVENVEPKFPQWICNVLTNSPFVACVYKKIKHQGRIYFVSTNEQFLMEHPKYFEELRGYEVTVSDFVQKVEEHSFPMALNVLRYTVCVTTQISTSRELNRTSPNNIAEQSTRFVNFGKKVVSPFVRRIGSSVLIGLKDCWHMSHGNSANVPIILLFVSDCRHKMLVDSCRLIRLHVWYILIQFLSGSTLWDFASLVRRANHIQTLK